MKILKVARSVPKGVWIASVILPGGFIALGSWILYESLREKSHKEVLEELVKGMNKDGFKSPFPAVKLEVESLESVFKENKDD